MSMPDKPEYAEVQKNQRCATRSALIVEKIPCGDGHKAFFGYAKNISRGGLFIATVKPRDPGDEFLIEFSLPTKPPQKIRCNCQVVWKRHFHRKDLHEPGMGLRFLDLATPDGDRIDGWVTDQTTKLAE